MPVGTVIGTGYHARKPSLADTVGQFRFQGIIRTVPRMQMGVYSVFLHLPRHDVDYAAHGVRAVQHRSGAPQHFHPFGQERLVGIGYRMTENAGILWMAVNQDHQPGRSSAQSAQGDASRCPVGHAITHHPTRGDEESGNLLGQHRQ